jgi:hypothetical protein
VTPKPVATPKPPTPVTPKPVATPKPVTRKPVARRKPAPAPVARQPAPFAKPKPTPTARHVARGPARSHPRHAATKHRPQRHHAAPKPAPVKPVERTPEGSPADPLAVRAVAATASLPAQVTRSDGSDSSRLLVLAAVAMVLVAGLSMSLLRLLFQLASPQRGA